MSAAGAILVPGFDTLSFSATPGSERWAENSDGTRYKLRYLNNGLAAAAATVIGTVYAVTYDGDEETNPKVIACAALAVYQEVAVATAVIVNGQFGWFAVQGYFDTFINGNTVDIAKDDFLKIVAGTDAGSFVGNTTTRTTNSHAIATEAETGIPAVRHRVFLIGERAIIT